MKKLLIVGSLAFFALLSSCLDEGFPEIRSFEEQFEIDIKKIESYLEENNINAEQDESGIYFVFHEASGGNSPTLEDVVEVNYEGRLLNDDVFDASKDHPDSKTFPLSDLIPAWRIMIPMMAEQDSITIYAPSGYCYGASKNGSIPANSSLIFEIGLERINPPE